MTHPLALPDDLQDQIVLLYLCGLERAEVARQVGVAASTVRKTLDRRGIPLRPTTGGPDRKDLCGAGLHSMAEHGREVPTGGRRCAACQRARKAKYRAAAREARRGA